MAKSGGRKRRPQGCSLRSHRLRRLKPLTPTLSPATHSAIPSMLPCCTSDLKRRSLSSFWRSRSAKVRRFASSVIPVTSKRGGDRRAAFARCTVKSASTAATNPSAPIPLSSSRFSASPRPASAIERRLARRARNGPSSLRRARSLSIVWDQLRRGKGSKSADAISLLQSIKFRLEAFVCTSDLAREIRQPQLHIRGVAGLQCMPHHIWRHRPIHEPSPRDGILRSATRGGISDKGLEGSAVECIRGQLQPPFHVQRR